ncbi:MAG: hypothetical protein RIG61_05355 [Deltaproteobacteria bacterium]
MRKIALTFSFLLLAFSAGISLQAAEHGITIGEFRQMYDSLLAGKTLVTETEEDGMSVRTERNYGQAISVGGEDFEVPVQRVITKTKDGQMVQRVTVSILDRVNDIGGQPIIYEEARKLVVENPEAAPLDTEEIEFLGLFRVSKNDKGGFDVHNFGLIPTVIVENNTNKISGSNVSYSCYPENNATKCVLTVRDYRLGDYTPLMGYQLMEPIGGDFVETAVEVKQ